MDKFLVIDPSDFFEINTIEDRLIETIKFQPMNRSFLLISQSLFNLTNYDLLYLYGYNLPLKCSNLYLSKPRTYYTIKPRNPADSLIKFANIVLPFTNILVSNVAFLNRNFCIAFNNKNYAIGFDTIVGIPCMITDCFVHLSSISLSLDSSLETSNLAPIIAYDSMRYHHIRPSKQFVMNFHLGLPLSSNGLIFNQITNGKGFHYRLQTELVFEAELNNLNYFGFQSNKARADFFLDGFHLFSLNIPFETSGVLRHSNSYFVNLCYPNGIFFRADLSLKRTKIFASKHLAAVIGDYMFTVDAIAEYGFFLNMNKNEKNGFFFRAKSKVRLFYFLSIEIELEVQKINKIELDRRIESLKSNLCSDFDMSLGSKFLLYLYGRHNQESKSFLNQLLTVPNDFFFMFYIETKAKFGLQLLDVFALHGKLSGAFLSPSPFNKNHKYYAELEIKANIFGFLGVGVEWIITDDYTEWKCIGTVFLFDINVWLIGSSDWLHQGNYGGLLKSEKHFQMILITPSVETIKYVFDKVKQVFTAIGETCQMMWTAIKEDVKKARESIKKVTDKLCKNPPCLLSNVLSGFLSIFAAVKSFFNSIFGRKKKETHFVGYNDYDCKIFEIVTKKCFLGCSVVNRERYVDKVCMDEVNIQILNAMGRENLANWKENILEVNMGSNLGIQYVIDQMKDKLEWFEQDDIIINEIKHDYNIPKDMFKSKRKYEKFDSDNTTFFDEFNQNLTDLFDEFDENEPDLNDYYNNTQELNITTSITINTKRLSNLFKGKDNFTVDVTMPVYLDFNSEDLFNKTSDLLLEQISNAESPLMKAILGDNVGLTDELIDAFKPITPVVSLKTAFNPTLYCDDPTIEEFYGDDDNKLIEILRTHLAPITIESIYHGCKSDVNFHDEVMCSEHETICGATNCRFTRFIFDGCGQKSNEVYEDVVVLPRKPYFKTFPDNYPLSCDETKNITISNMKRFQIPEIHSGCRNIETNLLYQDALNEIECSEFIYRKWRVEVIGCENSLYQTKNQKIYIQDKKAPVFSYFPEDKYLEFFDSYGTENTGTPKAFDTCGHGPSLITYNDSVQVLDGERLINRKWSTQDKCGNKLERVQKIYVKNLFKNDLNSNMKNFMLFSFNKTDIFNSVIHGPIGSWNTINLVNSTIGNDEDFEDKCIGRQKWTVLTQKNLFLNESVVHGSIKSSSGFDFSSAFTQAIELSDYLNDTIRKVNIGVKDLYCFEKVENLAQDYPISNYLSSNCEPKSFKNFPINTIENPGYDFNVIDIKGDELIYNLFYFQDPSLIENKIFRLKVPDGSIVIINIDNEKKFNFNQIRFDSRIDSSRIIYNFLKNGDIMFDENSLIYGTILAPYSNIIVNFEHENSLKFSTVINGQIFAKNIYLNGVEQECNLLEPLVD